MKQASELPSLYEITLDVSMHSGFSVIPLTGKRPPKGFNYSKYQTTRTTANELEAWFKGAHCTSYGVICGPISQNLFVLDFDSEAAYHNFATLLPMLTLSYTVKTRRGFHVYLRSKTPPRSQKIPGGDLLAAGSLAVGPSSIVDGFTYSIAVSAPILSLTENHLTDLYTWINEAKAGLQPTPSLNTTKPFSAIAQTTISRLISRYNENAPTLGRNNALYQCAQAAAYAGINQPDTIGALALVHAGTPAFWAHTTESHTERFQEATHTISSAYRAPVYNRPKLNNTVGLPNALREYFLKEQKSTITPRLLDAFAIEGWTPGYIFTTKEAVSLGTKYGLARSSILAVLSGKLSQIQHKQVIATTSHSHKENKTPARELDSGRLNSVGRKCNLYIVPDLTHLCSVCSFNFRELRTTDPLTAEDISSERAYRIALHRELIKRTSPELSTQWHASRLSVSKKTVQRYNKSLGVIVTPIVGYTPLTWAAMTQNALWGTAQRSANGRIITPGRWLQTPGGQRFPALKGIGFSLLGKQETAVACRRLPSRLQLPALDQLIVIYNCIWRHLDRAVPDWGGAEGDYPLAQSVAVIATDAENNLIDDKTRQQIIHVLDGYTSAPQDLTVIKGLGEWRQTLLNNAGILRYAHLAAADPERIARLSGMGQYVTPHQTAFWVAQAQALIRGAATPLDFRNWSFKDWYIYKSEKARIESASSSLRIRLAAEFKAKGWLKYGSDLPEDFIDLINT